MVKVGLLLTAKPENGGVYQYTKSVLQSCRLLHSYQFTIYTTPDNNFYDAETFPVKRIRADRRNWFLLVFTDLLIISIKDCFSDEDIIFATTHSPILLHTKTKFIFTLHDLQEHYLPENFSFTKKIWRNYINKNLCIKAALIECESEYVKKDISKIFKINKEKIYVLPAPPLNLSNGEISETRIEEVASKYHLPESYLFYPAQFWVHKNHDKLIEAFNIISKKFDNIHLVLTGKEKYEYSKIMKKIMALDLASKVIHLGYVCQEDLEIIYKKSLILVIPTLFESISIPIYEAFQLGVPVCASNVVSLPEQVGDAGILFNPLDVNDMVKCISLLIENPTLRKQIVKKGHHKIKKINVQSFADGLHIILESLSPN